MGLFEMKMTGDGHTIDFTSDRILVSFADLGGFIYESGDTFSMEWEEMDDALEVDGSGYSHVSRMTRPEPKVI